MSDSSSGVCKRVNVRIQITREGMEPVCFKRAMPVSMRAALYVTAPNVTAARLSLSLAGVGAVCFGGSLSLVCDGGKTTYDYRLTTLCVRSTGGGGKAGLYESLRLASVGSNLTGGDIYLEFDPSAHGGLTVTVRIELGFVPGVTVNGFPLEYLLFTLEAEDYPP